MSKTQYCVFSLKNSNYEVKGSVKIKNEVINQIDKYNKDEYEIPRNTQLYGNI